jgi:uncharacterized membrane protein YdjX (TVP38/TMEM64 family)
MEIERMIRIKYGGAAILLVLVIWFAVSHISRNELEHLISGIERLGYVGFAVYSVCVALAGVLLLPGLILTLGSGFLFGAVKGSVLFVAGQTLGACMAFFLGRRFFKSWARNYLLKHPKLGMLNTTLAGEGWKFIAITRMTPLFPFKISNYFFGAIGYPFWAFFRGTILGILPLSITLVYLGTLVQDFSGLTSRNTLGNPLAQGMAIAAGVVAVIGLAFISKRATRNYLQLVKASEQNKP